MRLSDGLLETARKRLELKPGITEADLRRATSDLYYVLFHRLCEALVEPIGANPESTAFRETLVTLYRLPDHHFVEKRCREAEHHAFPGAVQEFAKLMIVLKNKRQSADYHPLEVFDRTAIENDIQRVVDALQAFNSLKAEERARFAYFAAIRGRKTD